MKETRLKPGTVKRFLRKIQKTDTCWLWRGRIQKDREIGYGTITMYRKQYRAHRFSWMVHCGSLDKDICVLHKCDNPICVNPEHLFLGTRVENNLDRDRKGRNRNQYGK